MKRKYAVTYGGSFTKKRWLLRNAHRVAFFDSLRWPNLPHSVSNVATQTIIATYKNGVRQ